MWNLNTTNGTKFHFNRDLSGKVTVLYLKDQKYESVELDGIDLLEFAANYVRLEKIDALYSMSTEQLFGLKDNG